MLLSVVLSCFLSVSYVFLCVSHISRMMVSYGVPKCIVKGCVCVLCVCVLCFLSCSSVLSYVVAYVS